MKKRTKLVATLFALFMAFSMICAIKPNSVSAAENTTSDGSILVKQLYTENGLRSYIDHDGAFSCQDILTTKWTGYTDIHKIVVPKDGTLLLAVLAKDDYVNMSLYTNSSLTDSLGEFRCCYSSRDNIKSFEVKKGTYYLRGERWNGYDHLTVTTYVGFIPKDHKVSTSGKVSTTKHDDYPVDYILLNNPSDLDDYITNDGEQTSIDTITTKWTGEGNVFKFEIDEEGWVFLKSFNNDTGVKMNIYSNVDLTSKIATADVPEEGEENKPFAVYLTKGTYYYQTTRWNGFEPATITSYLGFMPASARLCVFNKKLSADHSYATVTFDYDKSYLTNFLNDTIRVIPGSVPPSKLKDETIWKEDDRSNALDSASMKITKNGIYTARIASKTDDYYCMTTFEIKSISNAPKMPKITYARKYGYYVKGTATPKSSIVVKVGSRYYKTTADKYGKWYIKSSRKLYSGTKIYAYARNASGARSRSTYFLIK